MLGGVDVMRPLTNAALVVIGLLWLTVIVAHALQLARSFRSWITQDEHEQVMR